MRSRPRTAPPHFSEGYGFASKLSAFGQAQVSTRSIDSLDVEPTFIKLHLEGGELDALRGARETLRAASADRDRDRLS